MDIIIFSTGGTIDKVHDPVTESLTFSDTSLISTILAQGKMPDVPVVTLMRKDSLDMTSADRDEILTAITARDETQVVVSHGTSTMVETAWFLKAHHPEKCSNKVVVLTGAMRPFSLFESDASFNLGVAIGGAQTLSPGVYVAMNGKIFDAESVAKETDIGVFKGE